MVKSINLLIVKSITSPMLKILKMWICLFQDRENFNKLLGETEDWLYDEGEDQHKQVYLDKLAELKVYNEDT